jgi:hypothetical protein
MFHTRSLKGYMGYVKRQAAKYGIKGSRLHVLKQAIEIIENYTDILGTIAIKNSRLKDVWIDLVSIENIECDGDLLIVNEKKYNKNTPLNIVYDSLKSTYERYGARSHKAEQNEDIDWKAMSHAIRASDQLIELYTTGEIIFPLKTAHHIKEIKYGMVTYRNVAYELEQKMGYIEELASKSTLPEKPDHLFWEQFLYRTMRDYVVSDILER